MGMVLIDQGVLRMALNVLNRAGKHEVAEELRKSAMELLPCEVSSTSSRMCEHGTKGCVREHLARTGDASD